MKKYINLKNIGLALTGLLSIALLGSAFGKLSGDAATNQMLSSHHLDDWVLIIGMGELSSLILFIFPQTMRLGILLLSAYFGGAIMFHMAHPDISMRNFVVPAIFLVFIWFISWLRGFKLFEA